MGKLSSPSFKDGDKWLANSHSKYLKNSLLACLYRTSTNNWVSIYKYLVLQPLTKLPIKASTLKRPSLLKAWLKSSKTTKTILFNNNQTTNQNFGTKTKTWSMMVWWILNMSKHYKHPLIFQPNPTHSKSNIQHL